MYNFITFSRLTLLGFLFLFYSGAAWAQDLFTNETTCGATAVTVTVDGGSFGSPSENYRICIPHCSGSGCTTYTFDATVVGGSGSIAYWNAPLGDVTGVISTSGGHYIIAVTPVANTWGKGRIELFITGNDGCICPTPITIDLYQTFTPTDEIVGCAECLAAGQSVQFLVNARVSRNANISEIGTDDYAWSITGTGSSSFTDVDGAPGDHSGRQVSAVSGATPGATATLNVVQGICNAAHPITKQLRVGPAGPANLAFSYPASNTFSSAWRAFNTFSATPALLALPRDIPFTNATTVLDRICLSSNASKTTAQAVTATVSGVVPVGRNYIFSTSSNLSVSSQTASSVTVTADPLPTGAIVADRGIGSISATPVDGFCIGSPRTILVDRLLAGREYTAGYLLNCYWLRGGTTEVLYDLTPTTVDNTNTLCLVEGEKYIFRIEDQAGNPFTMDGVGLQFVPFNGTFNGGTQAGGWPTGWTTTTSALSCTLTVGTGAATANLRVAVRNPHCYQAVNSGPNGYIFSDYLSKATPFTPVISYNSGGGFYEETSGTCNQANLFYIWTLHTSGSTTVVHGCGATFSTSKALTSTQWLTVDAYPCNNVPGSCCRFGSACLGDGCTGESGSGKTVEPKSDKKSLKHSQTRMQVSPNPGHSSVDITIPIFDGGSNEIRILDASGKLALKTKATGSVNTLTISRLPKGVYTITYKSGKTTQSTKFIKE